MGAGPHMPLWQEDHEVYLVPTLSFGRSLLHWPLTAGRLWPVLCLQGLLFISASTLGSISQGFWLPLTGVLRQISQLPWQPQTWLGDRHSFWSYPEFQRPFYLTYQRSMQNGSDMISCTETMKYPCISTVVCSVSGLVPGRCHPPVLI